jgi:hypothetical protein
MVGLFALVAACTTEEPEEQVPPPDTTPEGCVAGELTLGDGSCVGAGVPADACGDGFESDGALGCRAVLPQMPCGVAQIALPGDTACRPIVDCGAAPWGETPVDANTQYVDISYAGGSSNGSAAHPWTTVGDAVAAAAPGAIVAIAEGSYVGDVEIASKAVRLWGRCPELVEIVGTGNLAAIRVRVGGAEVRGVAVRGPSTGGVVVTGGLDVVVEGVWVHDTAWHAIHVETYDSPASATVVNALLERAGSFGMYVFGAPATAEDLVVRDTQPDSAGQFGYGLHVEDKEGARGAFTLDHALVERSSTIGIGNIGSDLTVTSTLVRDTQPTAANQAEGRGIDCEDDPFTGAAATFTMDKSVVELSRDMGIFIAGVTANISHSVVRDTLPEASTLEFGRALNIIADYDNLVPSTVTVKSSLFERSHDLGLAVHGSTLDAELVVVRSTALQQAGQRGGYGMSVQLQMGLRANVMLRSSVIEDSQLFGIAVLASDVTVSDTRIQRTAMSPVGTYGDGITARTFDGQGATATIGPGVLIADSARAGVGTWGATINMGSTILECNVLDLHAEPFEGVTPALGDDGSNVCRCQAEEHPCKASSSMLAPPDPIETD